MPPGDPRLPAETSDESDLSAVPSLAELMAPTGAVAGAPPSPGTGFDGSGTGFDGSGTGFEGSGTGFEGRTAPLRGRTPAAREPERAARRWPLAAVRGVALAACKIVLVIALAWGLLFNFSEVRGSSMEPGIHDRDRILVDHVTYLLASVQRGDVVVLRYPLDPSLDYIKRVIGLPGDDISIAHGEVWVNGVRLEEPYVAESSIEPWTTLGTTVRRGHYFVLGDNRRRSSDSREFGQVPLEYLRGKVRFRLWPLERIGVVE